MTAQMPSPGAMPAVKPGGLYLLELRRRFAKADARRQKLEVISWAISRQELVAIRHQPFPAETEEPVP